jgi:hypothetical protein
MAMQQATQLINNKSNTTKGTYETVLANIPLAKHEQNTSAHDNHAMSNKAI